MTCALPVPSLDLAMSCWRRVGPAPLRRGGKLRPVTRKCIVRGSRSDSRSIQVSDLLTCLHRTGYDQSFDLIVPHVCPKALEDGL